MDTNNDEEVILNTQEETVELYPTESTEEDSEQIDWKAEALKLKAEADKAREIAENQKVRAERAESKAKSVKTAPQAKSELSTIDIIALTKANIETDDIEEVLDYAKFKGISVSEALKSTVVKATLSERAEQRNVSMATNTGGSKRGVARVSDDALMQSASKGNLPESDADIDRLMKAMMTRKN